MRKGKTKALAVLMLAGFLITGCADKKTPVPENQEETAERPGQGNQTEQAKKEIRESHAPDGNELLESIPEYAGEVYTVLDNNQPTFDDGELTASTYIINAQLDELGRVGEAEACLGPETLPNEKRGDISKVHPSGWVQKQYEFVDGGSLYNRSHLLAHSLTGLNDDPKNLMTGTQRFNQIGMQIYEQPVLEYIRNTGNHVMYRVTPVFKDDDLVARGVVMEGKSVEDNGEGISYRAYIYNLQPGIEIDYATGENHAEADFSDTDTGEEEQTWIVNTNTGKIHRSDCKNAKKIKAKNRTESRQSLDELEAQGFEPAKDCIS